MKENRRVRIVVPPQKQDATASNERVVLVQRTEDQAAKIIELQKMNDDLEREFSQLLKRSKFVRDTVVLSTHRKLAHLQRDFSLLRSDFERWRIPFLSDLKKVETAICAAVYNSYEIGALSDLDHCRTECASLKEKFLRIQSDRLSAEAERDTALLRVAELKSEFADKISQMKAVNKEREATLEMQIRTLSASLARAEADGLEAGRPRTQISSDITWAQRELDDRRVETQSLVAQRVTQPANRFAAVRESPASAARKTKSTKRVDPANAFTLTSRRCFSDLKRGLPKIFLLSMPRCAACFLRSTMRRITFAASRSLSVRFASGMTDAIFHSKADEFIDNLMAFADHFDDVAGFEDIRFGDGVLSIDTSRGSYVINKQAPKHQIWLSSPVSGPHHYDLVNTKDGEVWACERDGHALHKLLSDEMSGILRQNVVLGPQGATS